MKRWTQIYKALANINRLKIIKLLAEKGIQMNVADIASEINISFKGTSKHLIMLHNLDILENQGRNGHVFYSFNRNMPKDIKKALDAFIS